MPQPQPPTDADATDRHFERAVARLVPRDPTVPIDVAGLLRIFDAQLGSRHLDLAARWMQARGRGYYTIGSSGHESNAALGWVLRPDDPALLHYRSGGFYLARAAQAGHPGGLRDVLLGVAAAAAEPISHGRHKVFGHPDLAILPQTSTIASHLPRAVGVAFAIDRARKLQVRSPWPRDAICCCSLGDASANHSSAAGAINAAAYTSFQGLPMPLLLVCEDNGLGISVPTPRGWIEAAYRDRPGLKYFAADGYDTAATLAASADAARFVRDHRAPAFLHLRTVRLMGHAGSDVESAYRTPRSIAEGLDRDPLLGTAQLLIDHGVMTAEQIRQAYEDKRVQVMTIAAEVLHETPLTSRAQIVAPLQARSAGRVARRASGRPPRYARERLWGARLPESEGPLTLAQSVGRALGDALACYPQAVIFGEDVAAKGGVYGVTRGLARRAGNARVFDTLLDEQTILGLGLGGAVSGLLPIPEVQYLAYLHNAQDQLRGEAASLAFFSDGQFRNPMVLRVASYAYQRGFGGHFHNDSSVAALLDIPGLVVASPARGSDAAAMLRTCLAAASEDGRVCVFLEPIARYHTRDLHEEGDGLWSDPYAAPSEWADCDVPVGRARTYGDGGDLTIVTFANGVYLSLRAQRELARHGVHARVLDLRWLAPLPVDDLLRQARATGAVLIADETRRTGGVSEAVVTALVDAGFDGRICRLTSADSYVPLGDAADLVLLSQQEIVDAARTLAAESTS